MKHLKIFEHEVNNAHINKLEKDLLNILHQELYTIDGEIAWSGKESAIEEIITYLKKLGIDFDLYFNTKKYNI